MGPVWVLYEQKRLYGAHVGPEWAKCPDSICPYMYTGRERETETERHKDRNGRAGGRTDGLGRVPKKERDFLYAPSALQKLMNAVMDVKLD